MNNHNDLFIAGFAWALSLGISTGAIGLDSDCDENGIPDRVDMASDETSDRNANGVLDACECPVIVSLHSPGHGFAPFHFGVQLDASGDRIIVGSTRGDGREPETGAAYIYQRRDGGWELEAKLTASDGQTRDGFGRDVAIDEDVAVVSAFETSGDVSKSAVYVYRQDSASDAWLEKSKFEQGPGEQALGWEVDVLGDRFAMVMHLSNAEHRGFIARTYAFDHDLGTWIHPRDLFIGDYTFLWNGINSLHLTDERLIAGIPQSFEPDGSGEVAIYRLVDPEAPDSEWHQEALLRSPNTFRARLFGYSAFVEGTTAMVSDLQQEVDGVASGLAFVYEFDGIAWSLTNTLLPPPSIRDHEIQFGRSLAMQDGLMFVGVPNDQGNSVIQPYVRITPTETGNAWHPLLPVNLLESGSEQWAAFNLALVDDIAVTNKLTAATEDNSAFRSVTIVEGFHDLDQDGVPDACDLLGDLNEDGVLDVDDLLLLVQSFGPCPALPPCPTDLTRDGVVDATDLQHLIHATDFSPGRSGERRNHKRAFRR